MISTKKLWLLDLFGCVALLALFACGGGTGASSGTAQPFRSAIDGDRPLVLLPTAKLLSWAGTTGNPKGARRNLLVNALVDLQGSWNLMASGDPQSIPVDYDDAADGPCAVNHYSLWTIPGQPKIWICAIWRWCTTPSDTTTLAGAAGCFLQVGHELGHVLGARGHVERNGRPLHLSGPMLCDWSDDCQDPTITTWTAEDVAAICNDGGHGGICGPR